MTKKQLADALAARAGLSMADADRVLDVVFDELASALVRGGRVEIRGFGSFSLRAYDGYAGRYPRTGKPVVVRPKRLPFFTVSKDLRAIVDEGRHVPLVEDDDGDETA